MLEEVDRLFDAEKHSVSGSMIYYGRRYRHGNSPEHGTYHESSTP
jgi:hypothetical protein